MLRLYVSEQFKEITLVKKLLLRYAISNYGRLISFTEKFEDGRIVKGTMQDAYRIFRYKIRDEENNLKHKHVFMYRLVAEYFLPKTSDDQVYVLHLDHNMTNDFVGNLKWATKEEMIAHNKKSPRVIKARKDLIEHNKHRDGYKLTSTKVILIKRMLANPEKKTRMKMIAKQFGISEMQLYRIKRGENWGDVVI